VLVSAFAVVLLLLLLLESVTVEAVVEPAPVEDDAAEVDEPEEVDVVPSPSPSVVQLVDATPNSRPKPAVRRGFAETPHSGGPQNGQWVSSA